MGMPEELFCYLKAGAWAPIDDERFEIIFKSKDSCKECLEYIETIRPQFTNLLKAQYSTSAEELRTLSDGYHSIWEKHKDDPLFNCSLGAAILKFECAVKTKVDYDTDITASHERIMEMLIVMDNLYHKIKKSVSQHEQNDGADGIN